MQPSGAATPEEADARCKLAHPFPPAVLLPDEGRSNALHDCTKVKPPCFAVCALVCDFLSEAECVPAFTCESECAAFVGECPKQA